MRTDQLRSWDPRPRYRRGRRDRDRLESPNVVELFVNSPADGVRVVRVVGDIDMLTAPVLDSMIANQFRARPRLVVLDLREVQFMSSSGLASLMLARVQATKSGARLHLVIDGDPVLRPMTITGLTPLFGIYRDLSSALG
jgi:anti-sigma B factor antagonist